MSTTQTSLLDPQLLASLAQLKLQALQTVDGTLTGMHASFAHGSSADFAEYKEYAPGDDVRHVDWKAFARSDRINVKTFHEERMLRAHLFVDCSGSMGYGEDTQNKLGCAHRIAASLAWLLLRQGDAVGLACFTDRVLGSLPPSSRASQLDDIIGTMLRHPARAGVTKLCNVFEHAARMLEPRSLLILLSDMLDDSPELEHLLGVLHSRRLDIIVLHILHPDELSLPFEGLSLFEGLEEQLQLLVEPEHIRARYQELFGAHCERLRQACLRHELGYHRILSSQPPQHVLVELLRSRRHPSLRQR